MPTNADTTKAGARTHLTKLEQFVKANYELYDKTIAGQLNRTERSIARVRASLDRKTAEGHYTLDSQNGIVFIQHQQEKGT